MTHELYSDPKGFQIALAECDVFAIEADALLFGRTPAIRDRIESSGASFRLTTNAGREPMLWHPKRDVFLAPTPRFAWDVAVSLDYRPHNISVTAPHLQYMAMGIHNILFSLASSQIGAKHVVIVPFGWRQPKAMAYMILAAIVNLHAPFCTLPTRVTISALSGLDCFASVLDDDAEFREVIAQWPIKPSTVPRRKRLFRPTRKSSVGG